MINYDEIFNWCAELLWWLAPIIGLTYKELNVWIFVIIEPIVFFIMLGIIIKLRRDVKQLKLKANG
tara:strand:- start:341 stop:538 length:198 start_codon:yes stop_codon:yes gene_type:complete